MPAAAAALRAQGSTPWLHVLGVLPSIKMVSTMGVGRTHADSSHASSLPVPVTGLFILFVMYDIHMRSMSYVIRDM